MKVGIIGRRQTTLLLAAFSISLNVVLNFTLVVTPLERGDDDGRAWALTHAAVTAMKYGTEFIATHGPLVYLTDRCPDLGPAVTVSIVFHLVMDVIGGLAVVWLLSTLGLGRVWHQAALIVLFNLSLALPGMRSEDGLFLVVMVLMRTALTHPRRDWFLGLGAALSGVFALIKLTLTIGTIGSLLVAAMMAESRRQALRSVLVTAGVYVCSFISCWLLVGQTFSSLVPYVVQSQLILAGYPYSLGMDVGGSEQLVTKYVVCMVLLIVWGLLLGTRRGLWLMMSLLFPMFITFKHAVVRMGPLHILHFPLIMQAFVLILMIDSAMSHKAIRSLPVALWILFFLHTAPLATDWGKAPGYETFLGRLRKTVLDGPRIALTELPGLWHLREVRERARRQEERNIAPHRLPQAWLDEIGSAGTDVWSFDLNPIPANGLTYQPRPTISTIIAPSAVADDMDAEFLGSERGTPYIFMEEIVLGIGGAHNFWIEPKSYRELASRYDVFARHDALTLLKRRANVRLSGLERFGRDRLSAQGSVSPPPARPGDIIYGTFRPEISLTDRLEAFVFKPDTFAADVRYVDGVERRFKFFPINTHHALMLNPLPRTDEEAITFFRDFTGPEVQSVRFTSLRGRTPLGELEVTWYVQRRK